MVHHSLLILHEGQYRNLLSKAGTFQSYRRYIKDCVRPHPAQLPSNAVDLHCHFTFSSYTGAQSTFVNIR